MSSYNQYINHVHVCSPRSYAPMQNLLSQHFQFCTKYQVLVVVSVSRSWRGHGSPVWCLNFSYLDKSGGNRMNYPIPELWELVVLGCVCNRTNRQENQGTWPLGHFHHLHDHHVCCNRGVIGRKVEVGDWRRSKLQAGETSASVSPLAPCSYHLAVRLTQIVYF